MIIIEQLEVVRQGKTVLDVEQWTVEAGQRSVVLGPNGSGKTTLLRVLARLTRDFRGKCQVACGLRERTYVHQKPFMFRGSVLANVRYGQAGRAGPTDVASQWLARLELAAFAERDARTLSGGELRRVALARALAFEPKLLLLDEPFADLDDHSTRLVCQVLAELPTTTVVIASPVAVPVNLSCSTYSLAP